MDKDFVAEVASAFFTDGVRLNKLDKETDEFKKAKAMETAFTAGVAFLRDLYPNERIRKLATLVWDIVGGHRVPVVLGPKVPTMSLCMIGTKDPKTQEMTGMRAVIMLPHHWMDLVEANPLLQMGAIVFVGSQAIDFVHGRTQHGVLDRARGYEAEYLKTLREKVPAWQPTDYQTGILKDYAEGIDTAKVKALLYETHPIEKLN
jgi:hypothetical protein